MITRDRQTGELGGIDPVLDILKKVEAVYINGHFVYTSWLHGSVYVNKDAMYQHPMETDSICELFAKRHQSLNIEVVVGAAIGGAILAQGSAYHLSQLRGIEVLGVYTEKDGEGVQVFNRGYDKVVNGRNVLVVEDITTTGGSAKNVVDTVVKAGGKVVAISTMVNRNPSGVNSEFFGAPFSALSTLQAKAFDPEDCPMCKENVPVNLQVGHGRKYLRITEDVSKS